MIIPLFGTVMGVKSVNVSMQRRLNVYLEPQVDPDKAQRFAIYGRPGLVQFAELLDGFNASYPIRGVHAITNTDPPRLFALAGPNLYEILSNGSTVYRGGTTSSNGLVSMDDNGSQIMIVDGHAGYYFDLTVNLLYAITDVDFPVCPTVCFYLGRFIVNKIGTGQFHWSALYDASSWNASDFATAESSPDNLVRVFVDQGQLMLLGSRTVEFWGGNSDASDVNNPFIRISGASLEWGLAATWSLTKFDGGLIMLGQNRLGTAQVVKIAGYQATPVSDFELSHLINEATQSEIANASACAFLFDGHPWYVLSLSNSDTSLYFDGATGVWGEFSSGGARYRGQLSINFLGTVYLCDYGNAKVYTLGTYTDAGAVIEQEIVGRHVFNQLERMTIDAIQLDLEPGVGLDGTGQGTDPQIMLQYSKDGGHTFGAERWQSMGKIGEYTRRVRWRICGRGRDFVHRIRKTDPVKLAIMNVAMNAQ